ncbi:MAG: tetratricopeptide repeat protein [Acidobacteriota bacterium]
MDSSIEELEEKIKENPEAKYYFQLSEEYSKIDNVEKAIECCEKGLELNPESVSGKVMLAQLLYKAEDYKRARYFLTQVYKETPDNLNALKLLGNIYFKENELDRAKEIMEKILFFYPFDKDAPEMLKEINESLKTNKSQTEKQEELQINHEESPFLTLTMAEILESQGIYNKAIEIYRKIYEKEKNEEIDYRIRLLEKSISENFNYPLYIKKLTYLLEKLKNIFSH